ncbi:MAG: glycosyltransferase family 2 protein [Ignavibacteria bacterium]
MGTKISVIIITKNEEKNIKECLESVKWVDEIIIVDALSEDSTTDIARQYTKKIFQREWSGFVDQKNYALSLASNEWVLSLDADERVTHSLKQKLQDLFSKPDQVKGIDGFLIKRDNYFLGKKIRSCGWDRDYQLRLFKKSKTKLTDRLVHEGFEVGGKVGKISEPIVHLSYKSFNDAIVKINHYSSLEALEKSSKKKANIFTIIFYPFIYFIQHFIFRYGFIDGIYGFYVSLLHAWTKMMVQIKIWELQHKTYEER